MRSILMPRLVSFLSCAVTAIVALAFAGDAIAGPTIDRIKNRGTVRCAVNPASVIGFSFPASNGQWQGFNIDFCHAVAAALLGDHKKIEVVPVAFNQIFTALRAGDVDINTGSTTATVSREMNLGMVFPAIYFYSGQGFAVRKDLKIKSPLELNGATICVQAGTTTAANLEDYFSSNKIKYTPVQFESSDPMYAAFEAGRCDAITHEPPLIAARLIGFRNPSNYEVLDTLISREPFAPMVAKGDPEWEAIVRGVIFATLTAEDLGIEMKSLSMYQAANPAAKRLLGLEGDIGVPLGLDKEWARRVIQSVGSYKDIYERNLGANTPLKLPRNVNQLQKDGGLLYPFPWR